MYRLWWDQIPLDRDFAAYDMHEDTPLDVVGRSRIQCTWVEGSFLFTLRDNYTTVRACVIDSPRAPKATQPSVYKGDK